MGIGDEIMASGEARKHVKKNRRRVSFGDQDHSYYSEIFKYNPLIVPDAHSKEDCDWIQNYPGSRPYLDYSRSTEEKVVFKKYSPTPGDIIFSRKELYWAFYQIKQHLPFILIEPSFKGKFSSDNKNWGQENWIALGEKLKGINLIQPIHAYSRLKLSSATGIQVSTFRESCALLNFSSYFISHEGGIHHAAAALRKAGIVIFGGFISSEITGYQNHVNLDDKSSHDSPCGNLTPCPHCRQAMEKISPEEISQILLSEYYTHLKIQSYLFKVIPGSGRAMCWLKFFQNWRKRRALEKLLAH
ncbi:glycosyltransferase family 9 protein [Gimesia panareensis]|uniref:glycosyltransferase family 9 protein n=1 Tax=Gimesia panareensis TaxID=2527978 RepID=UPI00118C6EA2|nr:glycosyltransferase family 9 protein [Gimesia panareensis]QDU51830.1 hypothetical protein Pan110_41990 [Gimesia panareensis]